MSTTTGVLTTAVLALLRGVPSGYGAADIDRSAVDWKTPAEIKWMRNAAGTNEQAVLFGYDGAKDEETIIWGMGPATATPAEKR